jgi:Holliday junction resolvase-like predicted endonuclease
MATLDHTNDEANDETVAFEQKSEALADALNDAPHGRHQKELDALQGAHEQLASRAEAADRGTIDAFFAQQRAALQQVQRAELDIGNGALAAADSLDSLSRAVHVISDMHEAAHDQLARERSEFENALAVDDAQRRAEALEGVLQRQRDAASFAETFIDGVGNEWTAAEVEERLAAGAGAYAEMQQAVRSADEATNDQRHQRGNLGERAATEALAAEDYAILDYKPQLEGTTRGGIDMVAMKDDTVYLLDNKALSRDGNVNSVSALTTNFENNLAATVRDLENMANDVKRSAEERELVERAITALAEGNYVRAVTNANVARDDRILEGVSDRLDQLGIEFIDVMRNVKEDEKKS